MIGVGGTLFNLPCDLYSPSIHLLAPVWVRIKTCTLHGALRGLKRELHYFVNCNILHFCSMILMQ
jgi:hypothetical protein